MYDALTQREMTVGDLQQQLEQSLKNALIDTLSAEGEHALHLSPEQTQQLGSQITSKLGHALLGCATASAKRQDCASGAVGDVTGELVGELFLNGRDPFFLADKEKQDIKDKVKIIAAVVGFSAGLNPGTSAAAGVNAVENNTLYLHKGYVVAHDKQDNNKVVNLNDKDARKLGIINYEETGLGGIPVVSDNVIQKLNGSTIYDLSNPQDFNTLKEGTDMGYYLGDGKGGTQIYFQNGMDNKLEDAKATASLISVITGTPVGMIANDTHGIASDTAEYLKLPQQTKDVLNEFTYRKLDQSGVPTLIVMHSAGNNDALQALEIGGLYDHQYPNLSFYSLGSPVGNNALNQIIGNTGGTYLGQTNDWRDPVTYSKTAGVGVLGTTGYGIYLGAASGCILGPLGCFFGGVVGGAAGGLVTAGPGLYGLSNYHPMTNYLGKPVVANTLQQWQRDNKR